MTSYSCEFIGCLAQPKAIVTPQDAGPIHYIDTSIVPVAKENNAVQPDLKEMLAIHNAGIMHI
jgi:hypothetical protein